MGLGINYQSSGEFVPYVKYDARAGRFFRSKNRDKGEQNDVDITTNFAAVFDLANIEVGWLDFPTGAAPIYNVQHVSRGLPPQPQGKFKQGFRLMVALPQNVGGGVYEMASTSKATISAIDELHTAAMATPEAQAGKLPVVQLAGTEIVETQSKAGTTRNYKPRFAIVSWIDRPASLPVGGSPRQSTVQGQPQPQPVQGAMQFSGPPATGAQPMPAPAAVPVANAPGGGGFNFG